MSKYLLNIVVLLFISGFLLNVTAQDDRADINAAEKAASRLQQKLLLSDDQTTKVKSIVIENIDQIRKDNVGTAQSKIEALLNEKQKEKFNIIKKDWFGALQSK